MEVIVWFSKRVIIKPLSHGAFGMVFSMGKHQCEGHDPFDDNEIAVKLNFNQPEEAFRANLLLRNQQNLMKLQA